MGLAERRKSLGYSQENFAHALGVDRTTVGRWERGETAPQPQFRPPLAEVLQVDLSELDALVAQSGASSQDPERARPSDHYSPGDTDDMIRRNFLRTIAVTGALTALPPADVEAVEDRPATDFRRMNTHLWQVYQLARSKGSVAAVVRDQLSALTDALKTSRKTGALCSAAGDLFQLAGELSFDNNRYTDAAASYTLAASASKEAGAYDLWACSLVRHAYVDVYERRYRAAADILSAAERVARRGDSALSTRYWVAAVQAEALAGSGDLAACERALAEAERVQELTTPGHNGGWLRFDGSRLAEERGARYVQLGRLDLAEKALMDALKQQDLAVGQSWRRRGVVLVDLAAIGAKRRDPEQVVAYGRQAVELARASSSGYVGRRLRGLRAEFGPLTKAAGVAELTAEIDALSTA
ncbi:helix-turn-helix transcriptional regulator [Streptomyces sp. NPDC048483]|uniref:helix-turn-helix transcriptional regulator n=1 Tax=Streptomyces sp. NPDC048483 TaxID=3154927 RepID=UPI003414C0D6